MVFNASTGLALDYGSQGCRVMITIPKPVLWISTEFSVPIILSDRPIFAPKIANISQPNSHVTECILIIPKMQKNKACCDIQSGHGITGCSLELIFLWSFN